MTSSTESPRIQVVEDNDALRRIVVRVLDDAGYAVTAVHGGLEALEELHTHCPSLMITDNRMPGMSGNAFIAEAPARFPGWPFSASPALPRSPTQTNPSRRSASHSPPRACSQRSELIPPRP
jgi:CheY-like chemotaxis protein